MQALLTALLGASAIVYPFIEARWYRLNRLSMQIDRPIPSLDILHVSDTHLNHRDNRLVSFIRALPERIGVPDLILATGDLIEDDSGIAPIAEALNSLPAKLGRFYVLGSHDYYQARFQSYLKYLRPSSGPIGAPRADTTTLERLLQDSGWVSVANRTETFEAPWGRVRVAGIDDPYLHRHSVGHIERSTEEALAIGLAHSPDVVSEWMLQGFDLVVAGHTHAGQIRIPGIGAVVTNSDLPTALAGGLHRIGAGWLHVSPGLGTGRFAPIRFNCRPEATLLQITGAQASG